MILKEELICVYLLSVLSCYRMFKARKVLLANYCVKWQASWRAPKSFNSRGFESSLPQNLGNPSLPNWEGFTLSIEGGLDI